MWIQGVSSIIAQSSVRWGTVGEWVSGVGALLAVLVAIFLPMWQGRGHRVTAAARVWARCIPNAPSTSGTVNQWHVILYNHSSDPVFDVWAWLYLCGSRVLEPPAVVHEWQALGVGNGDGTFLDDGVTKNFGRDESPRLVFEFSDGTGRHWRNDQGKVRRITTRTS